jgi:hypothetical protein
MGSLHSERIIVDSLTIKTEALLLVQPSVSNR